MRKPRRKSQLLNISTLEAAHEHFRALAAKEARREVRDALHLAALITSTLLTAVAAAFELRTFLRDIMGGDHGKR
jgi:hypothetical protein